MYWDGDSEWYTADVVAYDPSTVKHQVWYHLDEVLEWLNLAAEEKEGRIQWLPTSDASTWPLPPIMQLAAPAPPLQPAAPAGADNKDPEAAAASAAKPPQLGPDGASRPAPPTPPSSGQDAVGWRVSLVLEDGEPGCSASGEAVANAVSGRVLDYNEENGLHLVGYEDGEEQWLMLDDEELQVSWTRPEPDEGEEAAQVKEEAEEEEDRNKDRLLWEEHGRGRGLALPAGSAGPQVKVEGACADDMMQACWHAAPHPVCLEGAAGRLCCMPLTSDT